MYTLYIYVYKYVCVSQLYVYMVCAYIKYHNYM